MKKFQDLGKSLSKEQAQNVNGGISVRCRSVSGVGSCTITCRNGRVFTASNCTSCSSSSINGVESATCCGVTYNC
jgi:hypothetical protein